MDICLLIQGVTEEPYAGKMRLLFEKNPPHVGQTLFRLTLFVS